MPYIKVPVYGEVFFPDDMSDEQIANAIQKDLQIGPPRDIGVVETFVRGAEREAIGMYETIEKWLSPFVSEPGKVVQEDWLAPPEDTAGVMTETPLKSIVTPEESVQERSLRREIEARVAAEQNPIAGVAGRIGGAVTATPFANVPLAAQTVRGGALAGGIVGGIEGAISPTYEQFGDPSRLAMTGIGAGAGALLGGAGSALARWLAKRGEKEVAEEAGAAIDSAAVDSTTEAAKPRFRGVTDPETGEVVYKQVTPAETVPEPVVPAKTPMQDVAEIQQNIVDAAQLPKLPPYLAGAKPRFATSELAFETDIDRALYVVGKPGTESKRHTEYLTFLQDALNKPKEEIIDLAAQVRKEVVEAGKKAQREASMQGTTAAQVNFKMSKTLDQLINPVDKYLDDLSKTVYNYGKDFPVNEAGKPIIKANDKGLQEFTDVVKQYNDKFSTVDAAYMAKGYSMMLNKLKEIEGKSFTAKSFDDFIKNKHMNEDLRIKLFNAGEFDGC